MAVTVKIYREVKGVITDTIDLSNQHSSVKLETGDGSGEARALIRSDAQEVNATILGQVNAFNRYVSNINLPDANVGRDAYIGKQVRILFGFKQGGDAYEWRAEVTGGVATVGDEQLGPGQFNAKGFFQFEIRHKPVFVRETVMANDFVGRDNNANNSYGVDLSGYTLNNIGDLPALADVYFKPTGGGSTMSRAFIGVGRGTMGATSLLGTFTAKTATVNSSSVALVGGGISVTLANYPSGYTMPVLRLDSLPPAVSGLQISADGRRWFNIERNHAIQRTELFMLPVSRVSSLSSAGYTLNMLFRYVDPYATPGTTATLPAGSIHLFPCDQWIDYAIGGSPVAAGQILTHLATRNVAYVNTGSAGIFNTVIPRPMQGVQLSNDQHYLTALYEASDGTAPAGKAFDFHLDFWPRRRQV